MMGSASGLRALDAIAKAVQTNGFKVGGEGSPGGGKTRAELQSMLKDPRAISGSAEYDPAFAKQVDDQYKAYFR